MVLSTRGGGSGEREGVILEKWRERRGNSKTKEGRGGVGWGGRWEERQGCGER